MTGTSGTAWRWPARGNRRRLKGSRLASRRVEPGRLEALETRTLLSVSASGYGQVPMSFEANQGQAPGDVQFLTRGQGYALTLSAGEASLQLNGSETGSGASWDLVSMHLVGGNRLALPVGADLLPGKVNYLVGSDPSQWRTDLSTYAKVAYSGVYPGVDLVYYGNQGQLEYDFVVKPGADPGQIAVMYDGTTGESLDADGNLILQTSGGQLVLQKPVLYQEVGGQKVDVAGAFTLSPAGEIGFSVGAYDRSKSLTIDPILVYSTYFGGSGDDQGLAIAVDSKGGAYITGSTISSDLATTSGAIAPGSFIADLYKSGDSAATWQGSSNGLPDADFSSVVIDPTNGNIIYAATTRDRQNAQGLFKTTDGGRTWTSINAGLSSVDISRLIIDPVHPSTLYCTTGGFVFKTTDGGTSWTPANTGIAPDSGLRGLSISKSNPSILYVVTGARYLYKTTDAGASWTQVGSQFNFPTYQLAIDPTDPNTVYASGAVDPYDHTAGGVFKSTNGGAKFSPTALTDTSGALGISILVIDPLDPQTIYAAGMQYSTAKLYKTTNGGAKWTELSPGITTNGLISQVAARGSDVYVGTTLQGVLKSSNGGASFGGGNLAVSYASQVAIDPSNPARIVATTNGRPRTIFGTIATDAFVAKLSPDGKSYEYVTYLGGIGNDVGRGIAVDADGNAVVGGITAAGSFPTTAGALQATSNRPAASITGFVSKLNATGTGFVFSTYLGGTLNNINYVSDEVHGLVLDAQGHVIVTGQTSSNGFPTTANAHRTIMYGTAANAFVSELSADGKSLIYSTFLGGDDDIDTGEAIAVDAQGNFYVAGITQNNGPFGTPGTNFPTTAGALQSSKPVTPLGFFSKIDPTKSGAAGLVYSTIIGGNGATSPRGIAVDSKGLAYVVGQTTSTTLATTPNALQPAYGGDDSKSSSDRLGDGFLSVFDSTKSGTASLVYGTYLGGPSPDAAYAVAIDADGHAVIAGTTKSTDFPLKNSLAAFGGGLAAFVARLDTSASGQESLISSAFLGGTNDRAEGRGLALDSKGNLYVVGTTGAGDFRLINPAQGAYRGGTDAFVVKISPADGSADLGVTMTATPDPVTQGDTVTYTITVRNNGPDTVGGVFVSDLLDTGTSLVSSTPAVSTRGGQSLGFALGALASGATAQVQLTVRIDTPSFVTGTDTGTSRNVATVVGDRVDSFTANNSTSYESIVNQRKANLAITLKPEPSPVLQGQELVYRITVTNSGPNDAQGVVVTHTLPTTAILKSTTPAADSNSAGVLTFNVGSIANGASAVILVRMTPLGLAGGYIYSTAAVTATSLDDDSKDNTVTDNTVIATPDQADVSVALDGPKASVALDGITYTATIVNNGPHVANHVVFTGDATALATIVSITPSQGTASQVGNVITALLGTLAVGQVVTVRFVVNAPSSDSSITVHGSVDADEVDPNSNNDTVKLRTKVGEGAVIFTVTNTNDSGPGSLRQAILDSEDQGSTLQDLNHIVFAIPESDPGKDPVTGAFVIRPIHKLPAIFSPAIVDGYSQPGSSPNTNPIDGADNAHLRIEIDGSQSERPSNGFTVYANKSIFRGLIINRFITKLKPTASISLLLDGAGIFFLGDNGLVEGCFIGTDATGMVAKGNETAGVYLFGSSATIGGTTPAARNVISANGAVGVGMASSTFKNVVLGNFIGTDITGAKALPTNVLSLDGFRAASNGVMPEGINSTIGGTTPEARNIISGNEAGGVVFIYAPGNDSRTSASYNTVIGNYIGTDLTGTKAVPNGGSGVQDFGGIGNTIGGTTPAERNLISGNTLWGVDFQDFANVISGNYIGTDVTGLKPLGNGSGGARLASASGTLGGSIPAAGNLIAGNNGPGVWVNGSSWQISNNTIGLDADDRPLGNYGDGVRVASTPVATNSIPNGRGNNIGDNVIAYNFGNGITVSAFDASSGGTGNSVNGNSIYQNNKLGIDLGDDGVTPSQPALTAGSGANHLQNAPVLTSAISADGRSTIEGVAQFTTIQGTIAGLANRDYTIQFYANSSLDPTGYGEGKTFLGGTVTVRTDATGVASFSTIIPQALGGLYITATASTPNPTPFAPGSDTSEFSQGILVTGPGPEPETPVDYSADLAITAAVLTANPTVGNLLTYRFTITNNGPDPALLTVFRHILPNGFSFESASATQGAPSLAGNVVTANLGTLASGESQTVTIVVTPSFAGTPSLVGEVTTVSSDPNAGNNSASVSATVGDGSLGTDLVVSMVADHDPVAFGGTLLYTVTVTNAGPRVATAVRLTDTLPGGVTFLTDPSTPGFSVSGLTRSVLVGALAPGDSIKVFLAVQPTVAGSITNAVSVTLYQDELNPENNSASLTMTVLKSASVTQLSSSSSTSQPGESVTFTAIVTSPTVGRPTGTVIFRDGNTVLGQQAIDADGKASLPVRLPSAGVHTITAEYGGDASFASSLATFDQTVVGSSDSADLSITIVPSATTVRLGDNVTYTITLVNHGPAEATNVGIAEPLPAGLTYVSGTSSQGQVLNANPTTFFNSIGTMAKDAKVTFTVVATATALGTITNRVDGGGKQSDPNTSDNNASATITVTSGETPLADLEVAVTPSATSVLTGQNVTFTVTLTNKGPNAASGVTLTDGLSSGLTFVSTSQGAFSNGLVVIPVGNLASGASVTVSVVATATAAGSVASQAHVVSVSPADPSSANDTATTFVTVTQPAAPSADLVVAVTPSATNVAQGTDVTFQVTLTNSGPSTATGVTLTSALSSGLTFVSTSRGTLADGVIVIPVGDLASGASVTATVVATATGSGPLANQAHVVSLSPADPNAANDLATAFVTSNAPVTLRKTIDLIYGTITPAAVLGATAVDASALSSSVSSEIYQAIVAALGGNSEAIAGLAALRSIASSNLSSLDFFSTGVGPTISAFGSTVTKAPLDATARAALLAGYQSYVQEITGGGGKLNLASQSMPITLTIPVADLSDAASGQVRDGVLTVNVIAQDASVSGPVATISSLTSSQNPASPGQAVTFTAVVSGAGRMQPGGQGAVTFYEGDAVLGTAPVGADGKAVLVTSALPSGAHTLRAVYGGTTDFVSSTSAPVNQLIGDLAGPRVQGVDRLGFHMAQTTLVLRFDKALDAVRATNLANYRIVAPGADGKFGTRDDVLIPIGGAIYDSATYRVILSPKKRLDVHKKYRLSVNGSGAAGVVDVAGVSLSGGAGDASAGTYSTIISRANLVVPVKPAASSHASSGRAKAVAAKPAGRAWAPGLLQRKPSGSRHFPSSKRSG